MTNNTSKGDRPLVEAIIEFGTIDRDWPVRSAAMAAARISEAIDKAALQELLIRGRADLVAPVRIATDLKHPLLAITLLRSLCSARVLGPAKGLLFEVLRRLHAIRQVSVSVGP